MEDGPVRRGSGMTGRFRADVERAGRIGAVRRRTVSGALRGSPSSVMTAHPHRTDVAPEISPARRRQVFQGLVRCIIHRRVPDNPGRILTTVRNRTHLDEGTEDPLGLLVVRAVRNHRGCRRRRTAVDNPTHGVVSTAVDGRVASAFGFPHLWAGLWKTTPLCFHMCAHSCG